MKFENVDELLYHIKEGTKGRQKVKGMYISKDGCCVLGAGLLSKGLDGFFVPSVVFENINPYLLQFCTILNDCTDLSFEEMIPMIESVRDYSDDELGRLSNIMLGDFLPKEELRIYVESCLQTNYLEEHK